MAITLDGSNVNTVGVINSKTAVASTSGTSIDFTSIPAGVKRITVMFSGVSTNGTSNPQIQLGDSGGVETSGYNCVTSYISGSTPGSNSFSSGFGMNGNASSYVYHGALIISLLDSSTNLWAAIGNVATSDSTRIFHIAGTKALSATLDRVRITTVNGTDTFDAGSINILYE